MNAETRKDSRPQGLSVRAWLQIASTMVALIVGISTLNNTFFVPANLEKSRKEWLLDVERIRDDMQRQLKALEALFLRHEAGLHQGAVTPRDLEWLRASESRAREDWKDIRERLSRMEAKLAD